MEGGRDKSGLDFKRNRVYDPETGRFTQEDPIGLAGGLNLYGFAEGDPVNYSDPFGLCLEDLCIGEAMAIGMAVFGGVRMAWNKIHHRPATEGVAQDMVIGAGTGMTAAAVTARLGVGAGTAATAGRSATAFEVAAAGGRHAGLLRNYADRAASEIQQGITSLQERAAEHLAKIANPSQTEGWSQLSSQAQQGLLRYWAKEAAMYAEQASVLQGLIKQ